MPGRLSVCQPLKLGIVKTLGSDIAKHRFAVFPCTSLVMQGSPLDTKTSKER